MQSTRKPMPVGVEDFKRLVTQGYCFIDKTRFIKDYIDAQGVVTLITRPRRFGKTLTLSMLQYFFEAEQGEENRQLFSGLDIEGAGERYMQEQGTRQVVFLTLKEARSRSFSGMMEKLAEILRQLYDNFRYLQDSEALSSQDREYFTSILNSACPTEKMSFALLNLMKNLEKHHAHKPMLLLDEYDAPILFAWEKGYYEECIDFMRGFLSAALKTNPALGSAVLTGVTRISKESIFSGLNNLNVCSVLREKYSDAFGFTQEEAARLMEDCGAKDKLPELRKWYDGYRFGSAEIYNPWSVIQYVGNGCRFDAYWINVSGNSILKVLLERVDQERRKELEQLVHGESVDAIVDEGIIYPEIRQNRNALCMMLLTTGYLKATKHWQDARQRWRCQLRIPNREVCMAYENEILIQIAGAGREILLDDMLDAMAAGDVEGFQDRLSTILRDMASFHDTAHPESFYHGLMLGLSVLMEGEYRVASNKESGYGRFDIAFFPLREGSPGVILELKAAKSEEEMERLAKEGLRQIEEKAYIAELTRQGVAEIWKYSVAFWGKRIWMERA